MDYGNPDKMRRNDFGPKHLDSKHIQCLTTNVFRSHVNDAFHTETSAYGSSSYSVLTGTGLSDDPSLSNPAGEKYLCAGILSRSLPGSVNR